jgi:2-hydroxychromene-2-carboxylate isomerase
VNAQQVEFHFDFGSPNAYLSHKVIPQIAQRTGATFVYVPVLLGGVFKMTNNRSPMEAFAGIGNKLAYEHKEMQRFIARHGVARFAMNPHFPVNTLLVMRGAIAAEMAGVSTRYVDAVFAAMWEDGRKMDDPEVARDVLDAAGLDGVALLARTQEAGVKERLMANTKSSVQRGAFGSPTFFVGDEMFFGKDRLGDVEAALGA